MLDEYGFEIFEENPFPIAYLLTFRTFGTWLHGDVRGSHQRSRDKKMAEGTKQSSVVLNPDQRRIVEAAIKEVCEHWGYLLKALNVRSNHAHSVISKAIKPEKIMNDFKAYATRSLRNE